MRREKDLHLSWFSQFSGRTGGKDVLTMGGVSAAGSLSDHHQTITIGD